MSSEQAPRPYLEPPAVYQIRIKGQLGPQWAAWFEGLTITLEESGNTLLTGPVVDQTALHGLLKKVRDLSMPLLLVNCLSQPIDSVQENLVQEKIEQGDSS